MSTYTIAYQLDKIIGQYEKPILVDFPIQYNMSGDIKGGMEHDEDSIIESTLLDDVDIDNIDNIDNANDAGTILEPITDTPKNLSVINFINNII